MKEGKDKLKEHWTYRSQSIFRTVKRENPYVQIDRRIYDDARLSLKAMGLLGALLSKPNDWVISVSHLINHFKEGKAAIYSAIKELIEYGYMVRIVHRDEKKQVLYYEYLVFESPELSDQEPTPEKGPCSAEAVKTESKNLFSENREAGNRVPENRPLLNNDLELKNDLTKDPPSYSPQNPQEGGEGEPDLSILDPIAKKLFGQSNQEILENLWANIKEFKLDPEVIKECLNQINATEIKFNPYGYFKGKYAVAIATITKRLQISEQQKQLEELIRGQAELSSSCDMDCKSPQEVIAGIRKMLGITKNNDNREQLMT